MTIATRDTSAVFSRDMLDERHQALFDKPWLFETQEDGISFFNTEEEACAAQRKYRASKGFDPITGERKVS